MVTTHGRGAWQNLDTWFINLICYLRSSLPRKTIFTTGRDVTPQFSVYSSWYRGQALRQLVTKAMLWSVPCDQPAWVAQVPGNVWKTRLGIKQQCPKVFVVSLLKVFTLFINKSSDHPAGQGCDSGHSSLVLHPHPAINRENWAVSQGKPSV